VTKADVEERFKDRFSDESRNKFLLGLNRPNTKFIFAKVYGEVVGFCCMSKDDNSLQSIYVRPDMIGKGIGYKLWDAVKNDFDSKLPIVLEVTAYNQRAIYFYNKLGFNMTDKISANEFIMPISKVKMPIKIMEKPAKEI
jgi:ribosomal protein S18 acetylase RimI-like enzyme